MQRESKQAANYRRKNRRRTIWRRIVTSLACVVVFCTVYALILPAIALEKDTPQCGIEDHVHDDSCYGEPGDDGQNGQQTASGTDDGIAVAADNKEAVLQELAETYGIYPGTKSEETGSEVWTVYDAGDADSANIRATVTLPAGTNVPEDYYLYIRQVKEGEGYYPKDTALEAMAGQINENGVQCYAIHWVHIYQTTDREWAYEVETESVLGSDLTATVQIEYLKPEAYLSGHQANRKLQVYNSRQADGSDLENASTPTDVTANENAYTGFTFTTNRGGPYVFVSKYLYEGYVKSVNVNSVVDGSAPFDKDNEAGNDSGESNGIVRSYDAIQYNLIANFGARSSVSTAREADMWFEMTMDADITEAVFDISKMLWLTDSDYTIEYLNEAGDVVLTEGSDGKYYNNNGAEISLNDIVSGSGEGTKSYSTDIVSQRLRGKINLTAEQNLLAGNKTFSAAVQVLGADHGKEIQPTFQAWFAGNEDNYGSENIGEGTDVTLAEKVTENKTAPDAVTVSAAARFNLELSKNANVSYKNWFDSSYGAEISKVPAYDINGKTITGEQMYALLEKLANLEENVGKSAPEAFTDQDNVCSEELCGLPLTAYQPAFQNIRYGRMTGYGITLQVYNEASDNQNPASKGFKGISLPQGAVSFDLELANSVSVTEGTVDETQYYAQLWEYNENVNEDQGNQKKNMYWAELASTRYAAWAAPYNKGDGNSYSTCYNGGNWSLNDPSGYHFTIDGYDFHFLSSGLQFPTHKAGNSGATSGYNTYIGSYSAGYVQVLNVFPRRQTGTINMSTGITVKNLEVTTTDGTRFAADQGDKTGYEHETNTKDNSLTDDIPLYAPGGMTKANAFDTAALYENDTADFASKQYFLGTDFWGTSYDCSAFAGQEITLAGAARINAGDYQIRHANMLQLFDSEALSLIKGKTPKVISRVTGAKEGTTNILYAADPDYKEGYDTNQKDVLEYMSTVREEDLIYYENLDALEADGYTCVGVMAELRNWTINGEGGYSTVLKIPMTVSQDDKFLGKTVGTVNTVRIWTNAESMEHGTVSWKDGRYNESTGKNSVEGYTQVDKNSKEEYSGEVANGSAYAKTEYENGQVIFGSNTGGYVYGSSLLILNYKSEVDIEVDNKGGVAQPAYDLDKGEYTVDYHLKDIIAKTDDAIGSAQDTKTNLTVLAKMDTGRQSEEGADQRIAVAADSYNMVPASEKMVLLDENGNRLEEQSVQIHSDPDNPVTVRYAFLDPETGEIDPEQTYEIQVYARRDTNGMQVAFELQAVTVGVSVPDITFDALIEPDAVKNNDTIQSSAYISGTSDVRAYSTTNGNMDTVSIGIIQLAGTRLIKAVDQNYIELDGVFTYTVTYTNSGQEPVNLFLYDLLPDPDDIRDSEYEGEAILRKVAATLRGESGFTAEIQFYYSKLPYSFLYDKVSVFGNEDGTGKNQEKIKEMLSNREWFTPLGTIDSTNNHEFQISDELKGLPEDELTEEMRQMTGIYAVVTGLGGGKSLSIELTIESDGNEAGDLYRNIANSWLGGSDEPLTSNLVETSAISRTISGVVWDDSNFDGVRDDEEATISGVTCTLFKRDEDKNSETYGKYVLCKEDVTGQSIKPVVTGEDGAYSFERLAAGDYIVAFSGDAVNSKSKYVGATTYQANQTNDSTTNDAVALTNTKGSMDTEAEIAGIDGKTYCYAIAYSFDNANKTVGAAPLHTIDEILEENIPLTNSVELHANLDCGLVIASYELPKTGGFGTTMYTVGGLLLISVSLLLLYRKKKERNG